MHPDTSRKAMLRAGDPGMTALPAPAMERRLRPASGRLFRHIMAALHGRGGPRGPDEACPPAGGA